MAVATSPVLIDTLTSEFIQNADDLTPVAGPVNNGASTQLFKFGSRLYAILDDLVGIGHARCYLSTNNGLTWTPQDIAHEPGAGANDGLLGHIKVFYPGTGSVIYTEWATHPGIGINVSALLNSFDTSTNLWGTESPAGPANLGSTRTFTYLAKLSGGDQYVFGTNVTNKNIVYLKFSGGVWAVSETNVTSIAANVTGNVKAIFVDSTDTMHVIYQETNSSTTVSTLKYVQVSSTGVVGGITLLATGAATAVFNVGAPVLWTGNLVIPFQNTGDMITKVFLGTPLSAPVFSTQTVDPGASTVPAGQSARLPSSALDTSGNLTIFWQTNAADDNNDKVWMNSNSGSGFGSPVLFYNYSSFPPPNHDPANPGIQRISSPIALPNGVWIILMDTAILVGGFTNIAAFLLIGAASQNSASFVTLTFKGEKVYAG